MKKAMFRVGMSALVLTGLTALAQESPAPNQEPPARQANERPAPAPSRQERILVAARSLLLGFSELQGIIVEEHCVQCQVDLGRANKDLAPFRHIAGRFSVMKGDLYRFRDLVEASENASQPVSDDALLALERFRYRLELSRPMLRYLEPGNENPQLADVTAKLATLDGLVAAKERPEITNSTLLASDLDAMLERIGALERSAVSPEISDDVRAAARGAEALRANVREDEHPVAEVYASASRLHGAIERRYLALDQYAARISTSENKRDWVVYESLVDLMGYNEFLGEYSREWTYEVFRRIAKGKWGNAIAEARGAEPGASKLLVAIFHEQDSAFRPTAEFIPILERMAVAYLPTSYSYTPEKGKTIRLLDHPAFATLDGKEGLVIINMKHESSRTYRQVVAKLGSREWNNVNRLREALTAAERLSAPAPVRPQR